MQQQQVWEAYTSCHHIIRSASKTFYCGSLLLPLRKRHAIWAIYALLRIVDDLVDETVTPKAPRVGHLRGSSAPLRELDGWRRALERLYHDGKTDNHPVLIAWSDTLVHYPVPLGPTLDLFDGIEMDLTQQRYQTFDELSLYCYRVAGTVGLLTSAIFGYQDEVALRYAVDLGIAMQLTNILRDIGEDAHHGRIYLPLDELIRFGYSEDDLLKGVVNEAFCELVRFQMTRADEYYQRAQPGIALLSVDCRLAVMLSSILYQRVLEHIRLNHYDVFTKRAAVPLIEKLSIVFQSWLMHRRAVVQWA